MTVHATNPRTYSGLECPSAHLMALRSTLIWSTTPLSNIFSSFCTRSKLRSSITPDTYVVPTHNEKGLSLLTLLYEFYFLPEINCSAAQRIGQKPSFDQACPRVRLRFLPKLAGRIRTKILQDHATCSERISRIRLRSLVAERERRGGSS